MNFRDQLITMTNTAKERIAKEKEEYEKTINETYSKTPEQRKWDDVNEIICNIQAVCTKAANEGKHVAEIMYLDFFNSEIKDCVMKFDGRYWCKTGYQPWVLKVEQAIRDLGLTPEYINENDGLGQWSRDYLAAKWD